MKENKHTGLQFALKIKQMFMKKENEEVILFRKFRQKPIHNQPEKET